MSSKEATRGKRPRDQDGESIQKLLLKEVEGPLTPDLDAFIAPMSREDFFSKVYQQKALAVKANPKYRSTRLQVVASLMEGFHPVKMLQESNSAPGAGPGEGGNGISVWMRTNAPGSEKSSMQSIKVGAAEAKTCYDAGHSLYFRGSEMLESSMLNQFATSMGFNFASKFRDGLRRSEIEVFAAHVGHKTGWHFDFQENFTIQLRGAKKWSIRKASVQAPHRACAMHFEGGAENASVLHTQHQIHRLDEPSFCGLPENLEEEAETVTLQAGDVLYHPAGCWHKVEAVSCPEGSNSLSINMSFFPQTWGDLVSDSLQQLMIKGSHWRERVRFDGPDHGRAQLGEKLEALKKELATVSPADILPDTLCREFEGQSLRYVSLGKSSNVEDSGSCDAWKEVTTSGKWKRNPLGVLSKTEDFFSPPVRVPYGPNDDVPEPDSDDDEDEPADKLIEQPEGYTRFDFHSNFVVEEAHAGAPHVHLTVFAHPDAEKALLEMCALPPGIALEKLPASCSDDLAKVLAYVGYITQA